jgi:hypothetical protein
MFISDQHIFPSMLHGEVGRSLLQREGDRFGSDASMGREFCRFLLGWTPLVALESWKEFAMARLLDSVDSWAATPRKILPVGTFTFTMKIMSWMFSSAGS